MASSRSGKAGQSRAERRIVSANRMPSSKAQATYARERASPNGILGLFGTTRSTSTAQVADGSGFGPASLPPAEGGRLRGALQLRRGQQQQAAIDDQRTVLRAWGESDDAMTDYNAAQTQRDRLDEAVAQNRRALAIARLHHAQGRQTSSTC